MELTINGKKVSTKQTNIVSLCEELNLNPQGIVVLHNENIIKKEHFSSVILEENDIVELLNFVSGG